MGEEVRKTEDSRKALDVRHVPADLFIKAYAERLEEVIHLPKWVDIIKTSKGKIMPPDDPKWLYIKAASICRKILVKKTLGIQRLRNEYRSKNRRLVKKGRYCKGSGGYIRYLLQQLQQAEILEKTDNAEYFAGRKLTEKGRRDMNIVAQRLNYKSRFDELCPDSVIIQETTLITGENVEGEEGGEEGGWGMD